MPYGAGYRLPAGKHTGILTEIQTKVKKKISSMLVEGEGEAVQGCRLNEFYRPKNATYIPDFPSSA